MARHAVGIAMASAELTARELPGSALEPDKRLQRDAPPRPLARRHHGGCRPLNPGCRTRCEPPRITPAALAARPPALPPRPLMTMDFAVLWPAVRPARPRYPVLVHHAATLLHASFRPHLTISPCAPLILRRHQAGSSASTANPRSRSAHKGGGRIERPGLCQ